MSENTSATPQKEQDKGKPATDGSVPEKDLDKVIGGEFHTLILMNKASTTLYQAPPPKTTGT